MTTIADWQARDAAHHWHPFTDTAALAAKGTRVIESAEGCWLTETGGHRLLDGMAGLWCVAVGYGRDEIVDAVAEQMRRLPFYNTFFQCTHPAATAFAEALSDVTPPGLDRIFFTNSGSEANDTAFRFARVYWDAGGEPRRRKVVARRNAYHGSTVLGASRGGMAPMHEQTGLSRHDIVHIPQPYWFGEGRGTGMTPEDFGLARARELEALIEREGPETIAAFIGEPIQGAGGVVIPPESYWPEIERICRKHGILMIADEVICGFGRTGHWWGCERYGFRPDMITMAKAMTSGYQPMGGVAIGEHVAEPILAKTGEFFHGFTYSGHPAACAAGLASLAIIRREGLVERVRDDIGPYLQAAWARLGEHPLIGETRMTGLIGAAEIVASRETMARFPAHLDAGTRCRDLAVANGLVMRAVGDTMIIAPPLVISREECDLLVERAWKTFDDLAGAMAREAA
ncbi:MAG: aspartate aminotransferase family protein [Paracoccaceae bacterium]